MKTSLIAGLFSGIAGFLVFLVIHHFLIVPIWFIAPVGSVVACLGGLTMGWSYAEIKLRLPPRPWTSLAVFALVGAILAPAILLAQLRPPLFDPTTGMIASGSAAGVIVRMVIELLLTATVVGGLVGWWIGRTRQAALVTALAGFIFALGPGHNIPLLGNTPAVKKEIILLVPIILVSSVVLVESEAWLARQFFIRVRQKKPVNRPPIT